MRTLFFHPITVVALLATTLVFIFAFQAESITARFLHEGLIAMPIVIQVYFNSSLTCGLMRCFRVSHSVDAAGAWIGARHFFELAVATATALFGAESGAARAAVVGVRIEVPVMPEVCELRHLTRGWFPAQSHGGMIATAGWLQTRPTGWHR